VNHEVLAELTRLETRVPSHNSIKRIENVGPLLRLHTLEIDQNSVASGDGLLEVRTVGAFNLSLSLSLPIPSQFPQLDLVKLDGNPIARTMSRSGRRLLNATPTLTYLDDMRVTAAELRRAQAWAKVGGRRRPRRGRGSGRRRKRRGPGAAERSGG
jgi:dynein assembly factor 1